MQHNILAMFENKRRGDFISFNVLKLPITVPQEKLQFEIVKWNGEKEENISAIALIEIGGIVSNKLLAI